MANKILIADDDQAIRDVISILLKKEDFEVFEASNGNEALEVVKNNDIDLAILDIIMPYMYGTDAAKEIRKISKCPILFLTAKSTDEDKVAAFSSGGDDYLQKPFSTVELVLRVKSLLKRCNCNVLQKIEFNSDGKSIVLNGNQITLTEKENSLLKLLYDNKGQTLLVEDIYEKVWNAKYLKSSSNTVMVHILSLRKKIEENYTSPKYILTVWGKGYKYVE